MRLILLAAALSLPSFAAAQTPARTPVLVELFTSEGCSSCPPADALLSRLAHNQPIDNAQIIVLGEHVDYWDQLGWHDRFSSAQFTARQNHYSTGFHLDSIYTPQMVVDGTAQFVGNDQTQAWRAVTVAARTAKLPLSLSALTTSGRTIAASVSLATPPASDADLYAALIDPYDTTEVQRGENSGRHLQHVSVVRTLTRIGTTRDLAHGPLRFTLTAPESATPATMQVVVFAQQVTPNATLGPILGAAISTPTSTSPQVAAAR
ncbi:DUF1223 domain-containing protein [Granulicella arctica]|uniref:DUF1223 domain-containing protein n=1 Tax=Granulicella arctica TaxID=940613 RepID=UPI0021E014F5|nr:DUF1223 domain-containing protein [Granulicella arctica]